MTDKAIIAYLRLAHGLYNLIVMFLFMHQGFLGLTIRKNRKAGALIPKEIRRHRRSGPVLVLVGIIGYIAGLVLVFADYHNILKYPLHLGAGTLVAVLLAATFLVSRKIKGTSSVWRAPHFVIGIMILLLYLIQTLIGIGILF